MKIYKINILLVLLVSLLSAGGVFADDELTHIRLKTDFNLWKVNLDRHDWVKEYPKLTWNGFEIKLPKYIDEDLKDSTSKRLEKTTIKGIDYMEVEDYLEKYVSPEIHRDKQDVTIDMDEEGRVTFDGFAFAGQEVDYEKAFFLAKDAYLKGEEDVRLPTKIIPPAITVENQELLEKGVVGLIATGETDYSGSPSNRRNNIRVGLSRYNGWLISPDETASATGKLGPVTERTGYLPELVIKGDKTVPEYGGGLCQVSTTLYRSVLFAGLPIDERRNHSYAVSYYDPQGLDATIYIPNPDLKFTNDTGNHILVQTTMIDDKAYSNIYGSPPDRHVSLIGPWYYNYKKAPPPRTEFSNNLPAGEKQIASGSHDGFEASWYRRISHADEGKEDIIEHIHSRYEARGLFTIIGQGIPDNSGVPNASEDGT